MTASLITLDNLDPHQAVTAGHLANILRQGMRDKSALTSKSPMQLLEQALDIVTTAEIRINNQKHRIRELESQVLTDPMTNLINRRGFDEHLKRALSSAHRHGDAGVLVYIDLDEFKQINDTLGHDAGDAALKQVGKVLAKNIRQTDIAARIGGDEFAILLTHTSAAEGLYRTRKLQGILAASHATFDGKKISLNASFGAAPYDKDSSGNEVLRMADAAMYDEKRRRSRRLTMAAE